MLCATVRNEVARHTGLCRELRVEAGVLPLGEDHARAVECMVATAAALVTRDHRRKLVHCGIERTDLRLDAGRAVEEHRVAAECRRSTVLTTSLTSMHAKKPAIHRERGTAATTTLTPVTPILLASLLVLSALLTFATLLVLTALVSLVLSHHSVSY